MKIRSINETLFYKPFFMFGCIDDGFSKTDASKKSEMNVAYSHKVIAQFENHGLIKIQKADRRRVITLTEKGLLLRERIRALDKLLSSKGDKL